MDRKYENSGNLFAANNTEVFRKGTVDIDGMDYEFLITATKTREGKVIYEAFVKAGGMYINTEITEKKDYNISGEIEVALQKMMMWGRKREDKNGNPYTRVSVAPAKPKPDSEPSMSPDDFNNKGQKHDEERQDIPF